MPEVLRTALLEQFRCTGDACEDTCCQGWGMQVDEATRNRYAAEAPELLTDVVEHDGVRVMRRDETTDFCVRFEKGWCGIQKARGEEMLGDACHLYPRVPRRVGEGVLVAAALSCPEVARLALYAADSPFTLKRGEASRLPHTLRAYAVEGLDGTAMRAVHEACLAAVRDDHQASAGRMVRRMVSVAQSLPRFEPSQWAEAVPFLLRMADDRLLEPVPDAADPYRLLHALGMLIYATKKPARPRLMRLMEEMQAALTVTLDWQTMAILGNGRADEITTFWNATLAAPLGPLMRRWLEAELSEAFFPFGGLGDSIAARTQVLAVRLATLQLALACVGYTLGGVPPQSEIVRVVQTLARFLDHLSDPTLSLAVYRESGWHDEGRLGGLLSLYQ